MFHDEILLSIWCSTAINMKWNCHQYDLTLHFPPSEVMRTTQYIVAGSGWTSAFKLIWVIMGQNYVNSSTWLHEDSTERQVKINEDGSGAIISKDKTDMLLHNQGTSLEALSWIQTISLLLLPLHRDSNNAINIKSYCYQYEIALLLIWSSIAINMKPKTGFA